MRSNAIQTSPLGAELAKRFAERETLEGKSPHTIRYHTADIMHFFASLPPAIRIPEIKDHHIRSFLSRTKDTHFGPTGAHIANASLNRSLASVKSFFRYLLQEKIIYQNPAQDVKSLQARKTLPRVLSHSEVRDFIAAIPAKHWTYKLMITFLYQTGLRISELTQARVGDLNFSNNTLTVIGKGNKTRIIHINPDFLKPIRNYLSERPELKPDQPLFPSTHGTAYRSSAINTFFRNLSKMSGVSATPHTLRHSFATHMLEAGFPISYIQDYLGHSDIASTSRYLHVSNPALLTQYKKAAPALRID